MTGARERMLEEASVLVSADVSEVTVEVVATRAGVARATAYRHFRGRDQLLAAVGMLHAERLVDEVTALLAPIDSALARIEEGFVRLAQDVPGDPIMHALFHDYGTFSQPEVREVATTFLGDIIRAGQDTGEIRAGIDPDEAAWWISDQLFLVIVAGIRDEHVVRDRSGTFVLAALRGRDHVPSGLPNVAAVLREQADRLDALISSPRADRDD